jgi:nucleoside-diphosphate-sugar epimerase
METSNRALAGHRVGIIGLGDLGGTLAAELASAGVRVTGVRRGPEAPAGVELVRADARDPAALEALPEELELLVVCLTPDTYDEAGYRAGYLEPARALAERYGSGRGRRLRRVLWVSSTAVLGAGDGTPADDDTPVQPDSWRGRTLREAETTLGAELPVTAVRCSGIYGPGRLALLKRVLRGEGLPSRPVRHGNRIHRDDAVGILEFLLARAATGASLPDAVLATDPAPTPRDRVLAWLANELGVSLRPVADRAPRSSGRALYPHRLEQMGYVWKYPDYRAGFGAILAGLRASGELERLRREVSPPLA